ncbi:uncharacterized protein LOC114523083 [Dendronephthya gigantea]|uniref:uncharacterized protein LOC114523083 n=1 Tax=Dendronephthya gigantea TaxID=151771 RepID=UPI0010690812|nr:uncharacterized protein LOC114523083 [Dendronephthya gigantea]
MASAAVETIVEEIVEQIVFSAVENAVESAVESEVEQLVEEVAEQTVEESVESLVEEEVESIVEQEVEQQAEQTVEESVENAVEDAQEGFWKSMLRDKVLPAVIAGITSGLVVLGIKEAIDKSQKDSGSGNTKETDNDQQAVSKVLEVVDEVNKRWKNKLEDYQKKGIDLGTFQYKNKTQDAGKTFGVLVTNMSMELNAAKDIAVKSTAHKSWNRNIEEFKWRVANACEDLLAVFEVKNAGGKLKKLDFPLDADKDSINSVLDKQMPEYKNIIKIELKRHLNSAVNSIAKKSGVNAVKKLISNPLQTKIKVGFEKEIIPEVKAEAKQAAKAETTVVINSYMPEINKHAAIPVYGIATLKHWMEKYVAPTAKKDATAKAVQAANAVLELPPAQIKSTKISEAAKKEVMKEYSQKIKQVAKEAVEKEIKKAVEDANKPKGNK